MTNELAIPHSGEHLPKDECTQKDEHNQQDQEPWSPGGRRGSQRHFYTNPPRISLASILDDDDDDGELDSQITPYLKLGPIQVRYAYNMFTYT